MAKNDAKVVVVKAKRPMSAAKLAQKERNIALWTERSDRIKRQQLAAVAERKAMAQARAVDTAAQRFVEESVDGPSGGILKKWLAGRAATFERCERFFRERPHMIRVASACLKVA